MRTTRSFSTISYNSETFLKNKLSDLERRGILDWWAFIYHFAEEDESKNHYHCFFIPARQLDTRQLRDELQEYDPKNPTKPLGIMPCRYSNFADWYLYVKHDRIYLASKGQVRKYHYNDDDFISSNDDFLNELKHTIDWSKINLSAQIIESASNGVDFKEFAVSHAFPVQQFQAVKSMYEFYDALGRDKTYRGNRSSHSPLQALEEAENEIERQSHPKGEFEAL